LGRKELLKRQVQETISLGRIRGQDAVYFDEIMQDAFGVCSTLILERRFNLREQRIFGKDLLSVGEV
jgi:hypothetical protein